MADDGYLLDNRQAEAGERFDALATLATLFDPSTFRHIDRLGIATGWRCWEVGAGGASVPAWLAERVGPGGSVLATDLDVSWLGTSAIPGTDAGAGAGSDANVGSDAGSDARAGFGAGLEVRRHDVGVDPPPGGEFDLVHARLVLVHVPQRAAALAAMVSALRPGGWLLLEEADPALQPLACPDESGPAQWLANKLKHDFRTLMVGRGVDLAYGRTLPRLLRSYLEDVEADASFPFGGATCARLEQATVRQIRDRLIGASLATDEDIHEHLDNVARGLVDVATSPMISAWGRKP